MGDTLTQLTTVGPNLTKTYKADGSTDAYDDAASFRVKAVPVAHFKALAGHLAELHSNSKSCLIRGKFVGADKATPGSVAGTFRRENANFEDQPLHWFMVDIDGFEPFAYDPVKETAEAVQEFIYDVLPRAFFNVSFYWHLSSSAGMPGKEHILKCHVYFWSQTAYTTAQMYEWAKAIGPRIDKAVYRRVQIHYTADPIFEAGRIDPVTVRAGWHQGETDEVDLVIDETILAQARDQGAGAAGNDMALVDPSEKDGLIGLFHRTFDAHTVLTQLLDEFEPKNGRRWTWTHGGGTPEGVWVHDDGMHVGSSHNTWPIDGIANLWDLVRVFKFGHLDKGADDFEQLDIDSRPIQAKPSSQAMQAFVAELPEIKGKLIEEKKVSLHAFQRRIAAVADAIEIEEIIAPEIRMATDLSMTDREVLASNIKARVRELNGVAMPLTDVRRMIRQNRQQAAQGAPSWVDEWLWVLSQDKFIHRVTKELITQTSFNALHDRFMLPFADDNGNAPKATEMALRMWGLPCVSNVEYNPAAGEEYIRDGLQVFNTYRPDLLPEMPDKYSAAELRAVEIINTHAEILIPEDSERSIFLDFLAFCVQNPGRKIRWAPLIIGMEGDGKTALITMMGMILGSRNVRILNNSTLESPFTGWAQGQSFIGVEELKLHNNNKVDIYNSLKPIISNDTIEVHAKGRDPINVPNVANLVMLSNFDDAVPVSSNDRRVFFIKSPFYGQDRTVLAAAIKAKTGMDMTDWHDCLFDQAIKAHPGALRKWLMEREISPSFKADGRAPETTMRSIAVELSRSDIEVAILGVLEEGGVGVYPNLCATACVTDAVRDRYNMEPRGSTVSSAMGRLGWINYGKPVRWQGQLYRWYYKGDRPDHPGQLADQLEAERLNKLVDDDFTA